MKRSAGQHKEDQERAGGNLQRGRECFAQRAWADARDALLVADAESALAVEDLERLALAAGLSGHDEVMVKTLERAHHAYLQANQDLPAARAAFWAGFRLVPLGELGRAQAWFARAQRIVERNEGDCVERGYLLLPDALRQLFAGNLDAAEAAATTASEIGEHFDEADLVALARVVVGRTQLKRGNVEGGLAWLDDAMLAATSHELSPAVMGLIYCQMISACSQVYALDRAREWTAALALWCEPQPQLGAFASTCLVHRAELMELGGAWNDSIEEARRAELRCASATDPRPSADAFYQRAEIHRLRGELELAEAAYAQTRGAGREPLPGLALLRLAQGRTDAAASAMRRILATTRDRLQRVRYLPAHIEVMLAAGELADARAARDELAAVAASFETEVLGAIAAQADAAVLLAEGSAHAAVEPLRNALLVWQRVGAPYIAARLHELLGRAFVELGDADGARLESNAARDAFTALGAAPDLDRLAALEQRTRERLHTAKEAPAVTATSQPASHGLSARELQVLRLIAAGKTNRAIATELYLSEKTVDRHVSNIFDKINVPSRAAATAYAYEHDLVTRDG